MSSEIKRYALVTLRTNKYRTVEEDVKTVEAYLPSNYKVVGVGKIEWYEGHPEYMAIIEGRDNCGWTLDNYVILRLGSAMYACREVDLTRPCLRNLPSLEKNGKGN